ncbi:hypothetical protein IFM89_011547 [Coptis chinensis]|uniref:Uncharacterized protein n=1 Tax=Coptis chinensis TaxID=261450 RepID=A0A835MEV9_9MAGN|nr:hypothetical protein IFM89_011547 [Coptis chinensis]
MAKRSSSSSAAAAVEEIIAQAMDQHMLEQVSSINLSGVIDDHTDSTFPTSLETRFRKLKSFPGPNPKTTPSLNSQLQDLPITPNALKSIPISPPGEKTSPQPEFSSSKIDPVCEPKSRSRRNGYVSSPSSSSESSVEAASPPRQVLCFWCSPKKVSRKKSKEKENRFDGLGSGKKNDEFLLSDLSTFSMKEQEKKMKRALKEQEKISRDAEQVVSWAKQLSARIDDFVIHDDSCSEDDERFK